MQIEDKPVQKFYSLINKGNSNMFELVQRVFEKQLYTDNLIECPGSYRTG